MNGMKSNEMHNDSVNKMAAAITYHRKRDCGHKLLYSIVCILSSSAEAINGEQHQNACRRS